MQTQFKDGSVMVCGGCNKDAEIERVGDDNKRICKVGVAVGKDHNGKTIWANVVAWHGLAAALSKAKKGDPVFIIGKQKSREYNGKTYTDLVADFVSVCTAPTAQPHIPTSGYQSAGGGVDVDAGDFGGDVGDGGELPF